jgi:hypothetical protein
VAIVAFYYVWGYLSIAVGPLIGTSMMVVGLLIVLAVIMRRRPAP